MYRKMSTNSNNYTDSQVKLMNTFRKLWEQHNIWTRSFIISTAADLPDLDLVTKRLLRNPEDFAKELAPFYGNNKASEFERLLKDHLLIGADLVNAAKEGNMDAASDARIKWYKNADEIAAFLASINLYWSKTEWQRLLYDHLKMVEDEATWRLKGQYDKDIAIYDDIEAEGLIMADLMSRGIIQQFHI